MQPRSLSDEQLRSLATEVRDDITDTETDWLEWKSALDLTTAAARFEVSRQILGMANRVPALAQRNCGGYGYILVGVEQGAMPGTDRFDPAQLHDWINPYIGATGPAWQPRHIRVGNITVLTIEVEPPRPGDSIHTLKKSFDRFDRGAIFVRSNGKTHPAEPEDIENLQQRSQGAQLDLDLRLIGDRSISWFDKQALTATIKRIADREQEAQLRQARQTQAADAHADAYPRISRTMALILASRDDRTIEQYVDEVTRWHTQWTKRAPERWISAYAASGHGAYSLSLTNLTDHNFTSVEVCLEIPGAQVITDLEEARTNLPTMPCPYGQSRWPSDLGGVYKSWFADLEYPPTVWVDHGDDGAFVTWEVGDVRPEQTLDTDPLYVLVGEAPSARQLLVGWSATSKSVSGVATGVIELPLSGGPISFDDIEHDLGVLDRG